MERAAALLNSTAQLVLWLRAPPEGLAARLQHAATTAAALLLAVVSLRGEALRRRRLVLVPLLRIILHCQRPGMVRRPSGALQRWLAGWPLQAMH